MIHTIRNTPPTWIKRGRGAYEQRVTFLDGLKRDENGVETPHFGGEEIEVDWSIWRLIMELNVRGFTTQYCCSGMPEDHRFSSREKMEAFWPRAEGSCGYVMFTVEPFGLIPVLPPEFFIEAGCVRIPNSIGVMKRRAAWRQWKRNMVARPSLFYRGPNE